MEAGLNHNPFQVMQPKATSLLGTLLLSIFVMILTVGFFQIIVDNLVTDKRLSFYINSVLQCVLAFIFPAMLTGWLCTPRPKLYLGFASANIGSFPGVILLFIFSLPAMNALIDWNNNISLPASMQSLQQWMRELEDTAASTTNFILIEPSIWGLICRILIIGCLTGFAEELFFRAGLQNAFIKSGLNVHVSVWTAAFIFSAIHFQFFGFLPRMIMGAAFGYLFFYSGSIWVPAFAHTFNNSAVVVSAWLLARGHTAIVIDEIGVGSGWLTILLSLLATAIFLILFGRKCFDKNQIHQNKLSSL